MSDAERPVVHAIVASGVGADALLTCRVCGATASSVMALSRIPCPAAATRRLSEMTDAQRRVVAFVNKHPHLLAALYDLDLMPLDLPPELVDARAWSRTVRVAALYAQTAGLEPWWLVAEANATRRGASPARVAERPAEPPVPAACPPLVVAAPS